MHSEPSGPVHGTVRAPPSKSVTHRAIVLSMLCSGRSTIRNPLISGDTLSTLAAAGLMGASCREGRSLSVAGNLRQASDVVNAGNSGTTARLLSSVSALLPGFSVFTGDSSLRRRPMGPIIQTVRQLGGKAFSTNGDGRLPAVFGGVMHRGRARLRADVSSQFASSLAISCPLKKEDTEIMLTGPRNSMPYLKLTTEMVSMFGCSATLEGRSLLCRGGGAYKARTVDVPGDFSSASFILSAAAVTGGTVAVKGLGDEFTQADSMIMEVLSSFGCQVARKGDSVSLTGGSLAATHVNCSDAPDMFPVICVVAAFSRGRSVITGPESLRYKETDRIQTTADMLSGIGVKCRTGKNALIIEGGHVRGGRVDSHGDHRIVMAACVAGLASEKGCTVSEGEAAGVSYPGFQDDLRSVGGRVSEK